MYTPGHHTGGISLAHPSSPDFRGFVSVDVETSGPSPSRHSLLSIGACLVDDPGVTFYVELKPTGRDAEPEAMAIHGLSLERLEAEGVPPETAMSSFEVWITDRIPPSHPPVLVSYNAPFDWMFVADYFHRTLGRCPFGHTALDLRSLYFGLAAKTWRSIRFADLAREFLGARQLTHHALEDAQLQAELFRAMLTGN
jgi:DNA polymerase III epsilon subunit-like protein